MLIAAARKAVTLETSSINEGWTRCSGQEALTPEKVSVNEDLTD